MGHGHAVVVGGSFAGLTTSHVLREHFDRVTVVERDTIPDDWSPRKGVPQSPHVHGILRLGREILEGMFPGFLADTERKGAWLFDQIRTGAMYSPAGWTARGTSSVVGYGVRRALLEETVRERVLADENIVVRHGRVAGLRTAGGRVCGVTLDVSDDGTTAIDADLVVDASGRASPAPKWLEAAGLPVPEDTLVNGFVGYASRWVRVPEDAWPGDMRFIAQLPMPSNPKGGILYPQDNGLHVMSLFGHARNYPPGDDEGFMEFLSQCEVPIMHPIVQRSEIVSGISTSRSTANRWRHYERLESIPPGFIAVGDAVAIANPIFGQGISNTMAGTVLLREVLAEGDLDDLGNRFHPRLAERLAYPYRTSTGFDLQFPTTVGERRPSTPESRQFAEYMGVLAQIGTVEVSVAEAILNATQTYNPGLVRAPELVAKVRQWVAEGRHATNTDPTSPPPVAGD